MAREGIAFRVWAVVFLGGCLGGGLRLAIDLALAGTAWAWDLVAINVVGSAALGAVMGAAAARHTPWWLPGIGAGLLGGFTTFSAMAAPHPDAAVPAALLLVLTLALSPVAAAAGWWLGGRAATTRIDGPA